MVGGGRVSVSVGRVWSVVVAPVVGGGVPMVVGVVGGVSGGVEGGWEEGGGVSVVGGVEGGEGEVVMGVSLDEGGLREIERESTNTLYSIYYIHSTVCPLVQ